MSLFLSALADGGFLDNLSMTICNVGSRKLNPEDDFGKAQWNQFADRLRIFGFEADRAACEAANRGAQDNVWTEQHYPVAVADDERERTLYVTANPMCSSLYPPDQKVLDRYYNLGTLSRLKSTETLTTTTIDTWRQNEHIGPIDFLQIDVQGADLDVLRGAETTLNDSVLVVQVEVLFAQMYEQQPVFRDIDLYMSELGFTLIDITGSRVPRAASTVYSKIRPGQLLWADAYYMRDPLDAEFENRTDAADALLRLACILDILEFVDIAAEVLTVLLERYGHDPRYRCADLLFGALHSASGGGAEGVTSLPAYPALRHLLSEELDALIQRENAPARSGTSA